MTRTQRLGRLMLVGAVLDAGATLALLVPEIARWIWGFAPVGPALFLARSAAALMAGWTLLLYWASREPAARRTVGTLTVMPVVLGLGLAEAWAMHDGSLSPGRGVPLLVGQVLLGSLLLWWSRAPSGVGVDEIR